MEMMPNGSDVLYCKTPDSPILYSDIIVDDMAEADAELTEADGEAYEKKLQRDAIREAVANGEGFEPLLQECYVLTGGRSVLVADGVNHVWGEDYVDVTPQASNQIVDGLRRDIYIVLAPNVISYVLKSHNPLRVKDKKLESVKFFSGKFNLSSPHTYFPFFQTEIQVAHLRFRQQIFLSVFCWQR